MFPLGFAAFFAFIVKGFDFEYRAPYPLFVKKTLTMFSISLGYLRNQFTTKAVTVQSELSSGSRLRLPLERSAKEQINYTKWIYSDSSKKLISRIKKSYLVEDQPHLVKVDGSVDGILLRCSKTYSKEVLYYLFDYLMDSLLEKGFWLRNAFQESFSINGNFIEVDRFDMVYDQSGQEFELTIESKDGKPIEIIGRDVSSFNKNGKPSDTKIISKYILNTLSIG